ncbi:MAG: hypothetical protein U5K00_04115 [Melioribacteraceae bacterium]|nr:hypothetical protein [Melioribacteraceae bacterium]
MRRKITILSLIFLLTLSTSGMPLILHYCGSMGSLTLWDSINFGEQCEMHSPKINLNSCCESETGDFTKIVSDYDNCCEDLIIDNSVKDNFLSSKTEVKSSITLTTLLPVNYELNTSSISHNLSIEDRSPPNLSNNKVYLSNSVFLI